MKKIGFYIGLLLAVLPFLKGADDHPLDSIIAIRSLESEVADQALPVALESQVVWVDPVRKAVFLYDGETGIYVRRKRPYDMNFVVHPGDLVKVVGVTQIGGFSNAIDEADMEVIGHAPLPEATMYHDNLRLSPLVDCDWMEISGRLV